MEKISVIIPSYKRSVAIEKAVKSVLKQTYTNFEVIVIDDNGIGSNENLLTKKTMQSLLKLDSRIKYIELENNSGGSIARNAGIEKSDGKYITFLDDDDEYYTAKLENQLKFYKKSFPKNNGFINCQMEVYSNDKFIRTIKTKVDEDNLLFSAVSEKILGTPSLFIPRDLIYSVNLFTDRIKGQEWDLVVKLIDKGCDFKHMEEGLVRINISENSITTEQNIDRKIRGIENIYSKQCNYFSFFSEKEVKQINHSYYLKLSEAYLSESFKKSFQYYFKAIKHIFFSINNLRYPLKLLIEKAQLQSLVKLIRG
jgi:glycosyltransferase involved in cell wall biosynthesis